MNHHKKLMIVILTIFVSTIALVTYYLLVHGKFVFPNKAELITFFFFYAFSVPIGILIGLKYLKNKYK